MQLAKSTHLSLPLLLSHFATLDLTLRWMPPKAIPYFLKFCVLKIGGRIGEQIWAIDFTQATKKRPRQKRLPKHHTEGVVGEVEVQAAFLKRLSSHRLMSFPPIARALVLSSVEKWVPEEPKLKTPVQKCRAWPLAAAPGLILIHCAAPCYSPRAEQEGRGGIRRHFRLLISSFIDTWCPSSSSRFGASHPYCIENLLL